MVWRDYLAPEATAGRLGTLVRALLLSTVRTRELVSVSTITGSDDRVAVMLVGAKDNRRFQITVELLPD